MSAVKLALLFLLSAALTFAQDDCSDLYPWYCPNWLKYCGRLQVLRDEWCRMSCKTCEPQSVAPESQHTCTSALSQEKVALFQENSASFALELYSQARAEAGNGNVFFSPASISLALGMVLVGTKGRTRDQIKQKLIKDIQDDEVGSAYAWLMQQINPDEALYKLYTATAMYVQQDMTLQQQFSQIVAQCFQSSAELRDFKTNAQAVRVEVNDWVEEKTNDKIKDLIPPEAVNSFTRIILVNAIYFKADWMTPFTEGAEVYKRNFYPLADPQNGKQMDFMNKEMYVPYFETNDLQVLELPYKDNELSMHILLPRERTGLTALESSLTTQRLNELISNVQRRQVDVTIPKWKLTQDLPLKQVLKNMGMVDMFMRGIADLSGMTGTKDLFVSEAIHKAFIEVNEKGTEAAAATAIIIASESGSLNVPPSFVADHPFFFAIQHKKSKIFLFLGSMTSA